MRARLPLDRRSPLGPRRRRIAGKALRLAAGLSWGVWPVLAAGCRQTPGSTTGALQPFTAPAGGAAAPNLMPFGAGDSRVPPPATGAVSSPNNYMGGVSQTMPLGAGPAELAAAGADGPVGSGIRRTGHQTQSGFGDETTGASVSGPSDHSGGMRVIDLTAAPPPPGYLPSPPANGNPVVTGSYADNPSIADPRNGMPAVELQPIATAPAMTPPPRVRLSSNAMNPAPIGTGSRAATSGFATSPSSNPGPSTAPTPSAAPGVRPGTPPAGDGSDPLRWRNPGAGY